MQVVLQVVCKRLVGSVAINKAQDHCQPLMLQAVNGRGYHRSPHQQLHAIRIYDYTQNNLRAKPFTTIHLYLQPTKWQEVTEIA